MGVASELVALRKRRGWSQPELAVAAEMDLADLSALETDGDAPLSVVLAVVRVVGATLSLSGPSFERTIVAGPPGRRSVPEVPGAAAEVLSGPPVRLRRALDALGRVAASRRSSTYIALPAGTYPQVCAQVWQRCPGVEDRWEDLAAWGDVPVSIDGSLHGVAMLRRALHTPRWQRDITSVVLVPAGLGERASDLYELLVSEGCRPADAADIAGRMAPSAAVAPGSAPGETPGETPAEEPAAAVAR